MEILYIDHYDSFSFNLIDWLKDLSPSIRVKRLTCDDDEALKAAASGNQAIVFSPGPTVLNSTEMSKNLLRQRLGKTPILGICLGHQILAEVAGMKLTCSRNPLHGATKSIRMLSHSGVFKSCGQTMDVASYHSLIVEESPKDLAKGWVVSAKCAEFGEIMTIEYKDFGVLKAVGLQWHPESFLTTENNVFKQNCLKMLKGF